MNPFKKHNIHSEDSESNVISFIASDFIDGNTEIDETGLRDTATSATAQHNRLSGQYTSHFGG